jgi:CHASE3 domain sensor protein
MLSWFNHLKLQTKFIAPVALLVLVGLTTLGGVLLRVHDVNEAVKEVSREQEKLTNLQHVVLILQQQQLMEKNFLLSEDRGQMAEQEALKEEVATYFQWAKDHTADADDLAAIESIQADLDRFRQNNQQVIDLGNQERYEEAMQLTLGDSDDAVLGIHDRVLDIIEDGKALVAAKTAEADQERQEAITLTIISVVMFGLVGVGAVLLSRQTAAPVLTMTKAAAAVEAENYDVTTLDPLTDRHDELGQLARVFRGMVAEVYRREQQLKQQVQTLKIEIDKARKEKEVAEITESEYFQNLQKQAKEMRERNQEQS